MCAAGQPLLCEVSTKNAVKQLLFQVALVEGPELWRFFWAVTAMTYALPCPIPHSLWPISWHCSCADDESGLEGCSRSDIQSLPQDSNTNPPPPPPNPPTATV